MDPTDATSLIPDLARLTFPDRQFDVSQYDATFLPYAHRVGVYPGVEKHISITIAV